VDQANKASDGSDLRDAANELYDIAQDNLNDAEAEYYDLLTDAGEDDLLEARGVYNTAIARFEAARDRVTNMQIGEYSLQVAAANAAVKQAESMVSQTAALTTQAEAALKVIEVQREKTTLNAPLNGIILSRGVEPGEAVVPGSVLLVIGDLSHVTLTVYLPEDRYGEVQLGQEVRINVDSFPDHNFTGKVARIADKAEFTPRNVQTVDGRKTTVFGVDISIPNPELLLKPGMPADVTF
jgi:HlyD family secretion protein